MQLGLSSTPLFSRAFKCRACMRRAGACHRVLQLAALSLVVKLFFDSSWIQCNLSSATASDSIFTRASFESADCSDITCQSTHFESSSLSSCVFSRAKLKGSNFSFARGYDVVFLSCDARAVSFKNATLPGVQFAGAVRL